MNHIESADMAGHKRTLLTMLTESDRPIYGVIVRIGDALYFSQGHPTISTSQILQDIGVTRDRLNMLITSGAADTHTVTLSAVPDWKKTNGLMERQWDAHHEDPLPDHLRLKPYRITLTPNRVYGDAPGNADEARTLTVNILTTVFSEFMIATEPPLLSGY